MKNSLPGRRPSEARAAQRGSRCRRSRNEQAHEAAAGLLLEIEDLEVHFTTRSGIVQGVRGVNLQVGYGETLGLVGESGSGKSVTVQAVMGLISTPGEIVAGDIRWKGRSLLGAERETTCSRCGERKSP